MLAVLLDVAGVVDQVARGGDHAEGGEREGGREDRIHLVELAREEQAREDEQVFDPLLRAQGDDRRAQGAAAGLRGRAVGGCGVHLRLGPLPGQGAGHGPPRVVPRIGPRGRRYASRAGSISTPGLSTAVGSSSRFAAHRASAKRWGRCRSYQGRWSRPTAWWWVMVPPASITVSETAALISSHCAISSPRLAFASTV